MKKLIIVLVLMVALPLGAADLNISGQSNKTYDGGTYDQLNISGSSNITVKNCKFKTPSGTGAPANIGSGCSYITLDNCEIDGNGAACKLLGMTGTSHITIKNCYLHNAADDGVETHSGTYFYFYDNIIADLHGCGTDGGCGPCYNGHSDAWELANVQHAEFKRNFVYNVKSTSCFFLGNWSDDAKNNQDFLLTNNIFYPHYASYVIYMHNINGVKMYNNTFWKGASGGMVLANSALNMHARNNIFHTVNLQLYGTTFDAVNHDIDYNGHGMANQYFPLQAHTVLMPNPFFERAPFVIDQNYMTDPTPEDFALKAGSPAINKGTSGGDIPTTDFFGNPRIAPYDLGAIEYQGTDINDKDMDGLVDRLTKVKIGPNPVKTHADITINKTGVRPERVEIRDSRGALVWSRPVTGHLQMRWNAADMSGRPVGEGLYHVNLVYKNSVETHRMMVTR